MAGSISFFHKPPIAITNNLRLFASLSIPSPPSKHFKLAKRRRNTLRPKILTKPYSPPQNPRKTPTEPLETLGPPEEQHDATVAAVSAATDAFPVEVSAGSLAKYGLYLLVGFVFQTVLAVWVLGNSDSGRKDESLVVSNPEKEKMILLNGTRNGIENLGERVEEIRDLARTARKNEKSNNGDSKSRSKIGVQIEVGNRLSKLRKSLDSNRERLPGSYVNSLSNFGSDSELKMGKENLVFKKKFGVESSSVELLESPEGFGGSEKVAESKQNGQKKFAGQKGFEGSEKMVDSEKLNLKSKGSEKNEEKMFENEGIDSEKLSLKQNDEKKLVGPKEFVGFEKNEMSEKKIVIIDNEKLSSTQNKNVSKMVKNEGIDSEKMSFTRNGRKKLAGPKGFGGSEKKSKALRGKQRGERVVENGNVGAVLEEENCKKLEGKEKEVSPTIKSRNGVIQEIRHKRPSETSRNSIVTIDSDESSFLGRNENSRLNKSKKKIGNDMWWLDLSYVLVVVMQRAFDSEEIMGLYTLTTDCSYTVAFEDRVDGTNFSYLLESFFEDLGGVSADIAPMSIKEVQEAMKSQDWNVFVVKKGQLKMYAGQPFEEVEMGLRALIEEI